MECVFPTELTTPAFLDLLSKESVEDFIIKERVVKAQTHDGIKHFFLSGLKVSGVATTQSITRCFTHPYWNTSWSNEDRMVTDQRHYVVLPRQGEKIHSFFEAIGLREKETLNGVALAGSCQFSCLADQLFGEECTFDWRPDIALRKLAVYVIAANEVSGCVGTVT